MKSDITKKCTRCKHDLPLKRFKKKGNGHNAMCNNCLRDYNREAKAKTAEINRKPEFKFDDMLKDWVGRHARMPKLSGDVKEKTSRRAKPIKGYPFCGIHTPKKAEDEHDINWVWAYEQTVVKQPLYGHPTGVLYEPIY